MIRGIAAMLLLGVIGGCARSKPADPVPQNAALEGQVTAPTRARSLADGWTGKWVGVEGLVLEIAPRGADGRYRLTVQLMDGVTQYAGEAVTDGIRFTRDGRPETIRHVAGSETGLKWLDGKIDCLMIRVGEGFCRD